MECFVDSDLCSLYFYKVQTCGAYISNTLSLFVFSLLLSLCQFEAAAMAADPEGKELKLYSQFQTEQTKQKPFEGDNWSSYFGPSDSFLGFSSPVESELGSYEIESDKDDDHTAELSRRMAQYMLQDEDNSSTASSGSEIQNKVCI